MNLWDPPDAKRPGTMATMSNATSIEALNIELAAARAAREEEKAVVAEERRRAEERLQERLQVADQRVREVERRLPTSTGSRATWASPASPSSS